MRKEEQPAEEPAPAEQHSDPGSEISLVDYFDQMDRAAFRRALEFRDTVFVPHPIK